MTARSVALLFGKPLHSFPEALEWQNRTILDFVCNLVLVEFGSPTDSGLFLGVCPGSVVVAFQVPSVVIPDSLVVGDYWQWRVPAQPDYPAATWTLSFAFMNRPG